MANEKTGVDHWTKISGRDPETEGTPDPTDGTGMGYGVSGGQASPVKSGSGKHGAATTEDFRRGAIGATKDAVEAATSADDDDRDDDDRELTSSGRVSGGRSHTEDST